MKRFSVGLGAFLVLFLAHSPAFAHGWEYLSMPSPTGNGAIIRRDATNRSETTHFIGYSNHVQLELRLVHLPPPATPANSISITTLPINDAEFATHTFRFRFDGGPWETRNLPESSPARRVLYDSLYFLDDDVIARIRKAQHLTIEVIFRDYGVRQFEFDVAGLQWEAVP